MNQEQILCALKRYNANEKLDQPTIRVLAEQGYLEVTKVDHMQSDGKTLLPTFITERGRALLK
jgi:hypothetical protein